jgi:hypothetical protein
MDNPSNEIAVLIRDNLSLNGTSQLETHVYPLYELKSNTFLTKFNFENYITFNSEDYLPENWHFEKAFPFIINFISYFDDFLITRNPSYFTKENFISKNNEELDKMIKKLIQDNMNKIDEEIEQFFGDEWNGLNFYFKGKTKIHIIIVLIMTFIELKNFENVS